MTERGAERLAKAEQGIAVVQSQYIDLKETMLTGFAEVKSRLDKQNGAIDDLMRFKIQVAAIVGFLGFLIAVMGGTVLTIVLTSAR